jgi:hypothetical protein
MWRMWRVSAINRERERTRGREGEGDWESGRLRHISFIVCVLQQCSP